MTQREQILAMKSAIQDMMNVVNRIEPSLLNRNEAFYLQELVRQDADATPNPDTRQTKEALAHKLRWICE